MKYIASDHVGFHLKKQIILCRPEFVDLGCEADNESVDYPVYAKKVVTRILDDLKNGIDSFGVLVCGTGLGMSYAANRYKGIRAAEIQPDPHSRETARLAKAHNNANMLCLGGRQIKIEEALELIEIVLATEFERRHQKRLDMLDEEEPNKLTEISL